MYYLNINWSSELYKSQFFSQSLSLTKDTKAGFVLFKIVKPEILEARLNIYIVLINGILSLELITMNPQDYQQLSTLQAC